MKYLWWLGMVWLPWHSLCAAEPGWSAANAYWGEEQMRTSRQGLLASHGDAVISMLLVEHLEFARVDGETVGEWDVGFWHGGDDGRVWLRSEGEYEFDGGLEAAEFYAGYRLPIAPFWDLEFGLRHDTAPHEGRSFIGTGIEGTLPFWVEVHAQVHVGQGGQGLLRVELEQDLRLANRWRLQPHVEWQAALNSEPEFGLRSGFTGLEAGLRVYYDLRTDVALYAGYEYEYGPDIHGLDPRDMVSDSAFQIGLRCWW